MRTRFVESPWPLLTGVAFFGGGFAYVAWVQFVRGTEGGPELWQLSGFVWFALVGSGFMTLAVLVRLTVARKKVVLEPDRIRFGVAARHSLRRADIVEMTVEGEDIVHFHLTDPHDPDIRRRAGMRHDRETAEIHGGIHLHREEFAPTVRAWFEQTAP